MKFMLLHKVKWFTLISIPTPQKGRKNGFRKPFRAGSEEREREKTNWKLEQIDKDKLKCNHCGKM